MMLGKIFLRTIFAFVIVANFFAAAAHAEIQTYEGVGEYFMTDETIDFAKEQAELYAQRDALEKISVYVKRVASMTDHELDSEEIVTVSAGILRVIETKFAMDDGGDGIIVKSFVTVEIDIEEVVKLLQQLIASR